MKKKKKVIITVIILIIIAAIITASYLALSTKPIQIKPINAKEMMTASSSLNSKIAKTVKFIENSQPPNTVQKIVFTKDEVNIMIFMVLKKAQQYTLLNQDGELLYPSLDFNGVFFTITFAKKFPFSTPFGKFLNIKLDTIPSIKDGELSVQLKNAYIGKLKVPNFLVNKYLQNEVAKANNNIIAQNIFNAVQSASIRNNTVEIKYFPKKVSLILSLLTFGKM